MPKSGAATSVFGFRETAIPSFCMDLRNGRRTIVSIVVEFPGYGLGGIFGISLVEYLGQWPRGMDLSLPFLDSFQELARTVIF